MHPTRHVLENEASRIQAMETGLATYDSAIACANGHIGKRFTPSTRCCTCSHYMRSANRIEHSKTIISLNIDRLHAAWFSPSGN